MLSLDETHIAILPFVMVKYCSCSQSLIIPLVLSRTFTWLFFTENLNTKILDPSKHCNSKNREAIESRSILFFRESVFEWLGTPAALTFKNSKLRSPTQGMYA